MLVTHRRDPVADLREILGSGEILKELVKRDLKVRYKRSTLGIAWTLLNPLLLMAVTTVVFSNFFRFAIENFPVYVLSAQVLFGFFSQGTYAASTSIVSSAALTRRLYIPPALLPIASVNAAAVNLLLSLLLLAPLLVITGAPFTWALAFLPVSLVVALLFTYGVSLLLAGVTVFFQDTVPMYQVLLLMTMYLTPIFWPIQIVPEQWMFVVQLNPLYHLVQIFRDPIYAGALPNLANLAAAAAYAVGAAILGWWFIERSRDSFAAYL